MHPPQLGKHDQSGRAYHSGRLLDRFARSCQHEAGEHQQNPQQFTEIQPVDKTCLDESARGRRHQRTGSDQDVAKHPVGKHLLAPEQVG